MTEDLRVGIIGDHDPDKPTHAATDEALGHAAGASGACVGVEWLPTEALEGRSTQMLRRFDALWCSPGSPYRSLNGALEAIRFARENGVPFIGTCGGFQHAAIEYARNVLGTPEAGHAEYDPVAPNPFVSALSCSPFGERMGVEIEPGSKAHSVHGTTATREDYRCNYGLSPEGRARLEEGGLRVSGTDADGEARIVELPGHPFYVATLFVPQTSSYPGNPHPLIAAFVKAGSDAKRARETRQQTA